MKRSGKLKERGKLRSKRRVRLRHLPRRPLYAIEFPEYIDRFNRLFSVTGGLHVKHPLQETAKVATLVG